MKKYLCLFIRHHVGIQSITEKIITASNLAEAKGIAHDMKESMIRGVVRVDFHIVSQSKLLKLAFEDN